jgi:hypothetical protein
MNQGLIEAQVSAGCMLFGGVRNFVFGHNMSKRCVYANQKETCVTRATKNP